LEKATSFIELFDPKFLKLKTVIGATFQENTRKPKLRALFVLRSRHDKTAEDCALPEI
jgi:hypothetical protein